MYRKLLGLFAKTEINGFKLVSISINAHERIHKSISDANTNISFLNIYNVKPTNICI